MKVLHIIFLKEGAHYLCEDVMIENARFGLFYSKITLYYQKKKHDTHLKHYEKTWHLIRDI